LKEKTTPWVAAVAERRVHDWEWEGIAGGGAGGQNDGEKDRLGKLFADKKYRGEGRTPFRHRVKEDVEREVTIVA